MYKYPASGEVRQPNAPIKVLVAETRGGAKLSSVSKNNKVEGQVLSKTGGEPISPKK
jgi:hypothetical protein